MACSHIQLKGHRSFFSYSEVKSSEKANKQSSVKVMSSTKKNTSSQALSGLEMQDYGYIDLGKWFGGYDGTEASPIYGGSGYNIVTLNSFTWKGLQFLRISSLMQNF